MNEERRNVQEDWEMYDTVRIGPDVPDKWPGGFRTLTELASAEEIGFLNVRNATQVGQAYTNITGASGKLAWSYNVSSLGMRFIYPDPNVADDHAGNIAASKVFCVILPEHAHFTFTTNQDDRNILKPIMMPSGHGTMGMLQSSRPGSDTYNSIYNSGIPDGRNRWLWTIKGGMRLPKDTEVKGLLRFSEYGKKLLNALATVNPLDFGGPEPFPNECLIEVTLRGKRDVQQRGDYYR